MTQKKLKNYSNCIQKFKFPENFKAPIAVACSGGKDSVALLLHCLEILEKEQVMLFHIDHQVRKLASCEEERSFIKQLANHLNIKYETVILERCENASENTLREKRYEALVNLGKKHNIEWIALAHHAQDQSESMLLHLLRGCDLKGLSGMRECFTMSHIHFFRPALHISSKDLTSILIGNKVSHFEDPTNAEDNYKRNKIRHHLIPLMEELQPGASHRLSEMSQTFIDIQSWMDDELLELHQQQWWRKNDKGELLLNKSILSKVPKALLFSWIHHHLCEWATHKDHVTRKHVQNFYHCLKSEQTGYWPEPFPGNTQIRVRKREIVVKFQ